MERRPIASSRLRLPDRIALAMLGLGLLGMLGVARWLEPDPRGFGTHQQLGLSPCAFLERTGRPCVTCGMTTAFAWSVRGEWVKSTQANPAGWLLSLALPPGACWLLACAIRGRALGVASVGMTLAVAVVVAAALSAATWMIRIGVMEVF